MTSHTPEPRQEVSGLDAVVNSFGEAFQRMTWMLFTGPNATFTNWLWWGLILLLAGVASGGNGFNGSGWDGNESDFPGGGRSPDITPVIIAVVLGAICCGVLIGLVFLYIRSRFRFVLLDGVLSGEPRIRDVWPRTSEVGLQYFIWELVIAIGVLLLALPILLLWLPLIKTGIAGGEVTTPMVLGPLFATIPWVILLILVAAIVGWFVYDLVLPLTWRREHDFWAGLRAALSLARDRLGTVLLFLVGRILVGIAGAIVGGILACCSCVIWVWPLALIIGLVLISIPLPPLFILTVPLMIALGIVIAWIVVTVNAPVYLFYRAWSVAFLGQLDPGLGGWDDSPGTPGSKAGGGGPGGGLQPRGGVPAAPAAPGDPAAPGATSGGPAAPGALPSTHGAFAPPSGPGSATPPDAPGPAGGAGPRPDEPAGPERPSGDDPPRGPFESDR